ncbi:hypothetical protein LCGC14_3108600, partial [marine sediment metagenome]
MPSPHVSTNFGDLLDPRFEKIFFDQLKQLQSMLPELYTFVGTNNRNDMRWSEVGTLPNWPEFTGTVNYKDSAQDFDTTATPVEYADGIQVERKLFDDDQYNIMDQRPKALSTAYHRTREGHGASMFTNAFGLNTTWYSNSEGVALVSNSHTTNSGASTASGFDNLGTSAISATALASARINMRNFRGDQAERIDVQPDEIWIPPDLFEEAFEIVNSLGKVDTANNNRNVHQGVYTVKEWNYLTDANDWFVGDSVTRAQMVFWTDRIPVEFAFAEDLDTIIAKWRGYA